ncbi:hypothetical protein ACFLYP_04380 [Chloroflexota bacterium]
MVKDRFQKSKWWLLALIILSAAAVVIIAPPEKTLGNGIKPVYVHISLTWAGMVTFFAAGVLGLLGALSGSQRLIPRLKTLYWVSFGLYLAGFLVSILASIVNWGGVPFDEPRVLSALNVLVVGAVGGLMMRLIPWGQIASLMGALPTIVVYFGVQSEQIALHPDSPVSQAPASIKNSFMGMFALALLLGLWLLAYYWPSKEV